MKKSDKTKQRLLSAFMSLVMCFSMFAGTTFAWFTDTATTGVQNIVSGTLDVDIVDKDGNTLTNVPLAFVKAAGHEAEELLWEPGVTYELQDFYIANKGNLALKYKLHINGAIGDNKLLEALEFSVKVDGAETNINTYEGHLTAKGTENDTSKLVKVYVHMKEDAGNEYQDLKLEGLGITVYATQDTVEYDSYGNTYDIEAKYSLLNSPVSVTCDIPAEKVENGVLTEDITIYAFDGVYATLPANTKLADGATQLHFTVNYLEDSNSGIDVSDNKNQTSVDVHISGVAEDNTQPIEICLGNMLSTGLNMGNYNLYHVEESGTQTMIENDALSVHNQFEYDPATGFVTIAIATFSEVAAVSETEENNQWNGEFDYTWYDADATEFTIANADQLAAFGAIVGGMNGQTQDSFSGKTVKLLADINLGDAEDANTDKIFYPIGYYYTDDKNADGATGDYYSTVNSFEGTFDGNGHTISNFYQNTWEIKGDYSGNYYNDAMGLFGSIYNGTVKNLTVDHFSSDGEFTPTGVIAAYAGGNATFENIAITNCNPRVYNTGNGGIVGLNYNSTNGTADKLTFKNITVDNTNTISALWGSYDVACGGILGRLRDNSKHTNTESGTYNTVSFENCHVAAKMDVYNDVCGNYQYYQYRYSGSLIGTVDYLNETPNISKDFVLKTIVSAKNTTVHYGEWNNYYYCEFVKNGNPSYCNKEQDFKFSRVDANADGTPVDGHTHSDSREDNHMVYLPFNQLFTGYGWGASHVKVGDLEGVTILDREVADSVEKFAKADEAQESYKTGTTVTVGELFKAATIEDSKLTIKPEQVQVTVSPVGETSTAGGTYEANTTDWTQGTLTFSGIGTATITITDYYFCKPTTINITVVEPDSVDKFDLVFENTDDYLYRVGNGNAVSLVSLFKSKDGVEIGNVTVNVEALNGATVSGTYTANTSDWKQGTIQFSGTGPVLVTIDDDAYANEKKLYLEVVDATNVTTYSELGNKNSVLLNDITMSSGGSYYLSGATLYGNGFTFDMTDGTYAAGGNTSSNYVLGLDNANLDNVKVVGAVYTTYGATVQSEYNRAAVLSTGNNTITNSYISNCASAVRVKDGNLEIVNSTIKGGNFANIDIRGGHVVLDNVTTINQVNGNDTADDGTMVVGFGVVVYFENVLNTTTLEIKNGITQYNHLSKTQFETYITDATAKQLKDTIYGSDLGAVQYTDDNGEIWVNTGILSMSSEVGNDNITNVEGYVDASPSMLGTTGYLHTSKPDAASIAATAPAYATAGQGAIAPSYSFDYKTKNYTAKTDGSNDYCYAEGGTVYISMDAGDTFNWDTSILTATKNGQTLDYTVAMNGTDYTGKSIAFNTAGNYEVTYTYTDSNNYSVDEDGNITTYGKTYTKTVHISVAVVEASAKKAEFTMGSSNAATEKITVDNVTYISATGVTADNSTWTYMTVGDQKIYYPIIAAKLTSTKGLSSYAYFPVFENAVTITDYADGGTGAAVTYNSSTTTVPSGLTAVKGIYKAAADVKSWTNLNNSNLTQSGASKIFKWASSSDAPSAPTTYNDVLCYKSPQISANRAAYLTLVQYSYTDATNTTYYYYVGYTLEAFEKSSICVSPDTLVTLADGSQKEIQHLTYDDELLVWNFYTGEYDIAPTSLIINHGKDINEIIKLNFSDGTTINFVGCHGAFNATLNEFVDIDSDNVKDFVGDTFLKVNNNGFEKVKLIDYELNKEYTGSYTLLSSEHYNAILNNMLTVSPSALAENLYEAFEVGEGMKYDAEKMQEDIKKYGLYTYEDFKDYVTYEQFKAWKLENMKVVVGKGYTTYEDIVTMLLAFAVPNA